MESSTQSPLRKFVAPEFIFGVGSSQLAGQYARNLGGTKAFVVSDAGVAATGWLQKTIENLESVGMQCEPFTSVSANPLLEEVAAGVARFSETGCDVIVAVGGGSVIDCAKAIGVASANRGDIRELAGVDNVLSPMPPTICIPTTAGTSADVSQFAVLRDQVNRRKLLIISKAVVPDLSLVDPAMLTTMDAYLTACTGLDALVHGIEAYVSLGHSPLTDLHALEGIRLITTNLVHSIAEPDNLEFRSNMMLGSLEVGLAFSNASLGAVHAMSHSIGGVFDLAHGECNAMLLDHVLAYNFTAAEDRYRKIAIAMGLEVKGRNAREVCNDLLAAARDLRKAVGIEPGFSRFGLHRSDLHELAEFSLLDPCIVTNPRLPSRRDIEVVYEESL
jgi:alcohol dehydrogenase class IV